MFYVTRIAYALLFLGLGILIERVLQAWRDRNKE